MPQRRPADQRTVAAEPPLYDDRLERAGVSLPLEPALRDRIAPGLEGRLGVVMAFLPRISRAAQARARTALEDALARGRSNRSPCS